MARSVAEVAGASARELRIEARATLEQFAAAARHYGLRWTSGRVGDFEGGRTAPTMPTLIVVAAVLSDLLGRDVALAELFAGAGRVAINERLSLDADDLRSLFSEGYAVTLSDVYGDIEQLRESTSEYVKQRKSWPESLHSVPMDLHRRVYDSMSDSDLRMCKNIGVGRDMGAAAMACLWGETFTARRDLLAGPGVKAQHRGQVSRRLKAELLALMEGGKA